MEEAMQLYQLAQPEIATFTIYQMGRAANAMVFIGTILAIWLSLRIVHSACVFRLIRNLFQSFCT